jgi:hypothetical protein
MRRAIAFIVGVFLLALGSWALAQVSLPFPGPGAKGAGGAWHTIVSVNYSGASDNSGWNNYGIRAWVGTAAYSGASNATQIRAGFLSASGGNLVLSDVFIGHSAGPTGTSTQNYDGSQVRLKFSTVNGVTIPTNSSVVSDGSTYSFDATKDLVVGINTTSGGTKQISAGTSSQYQLVWNSSQASCSAPNTTCTYSFAPGGGTTDFLLNIDVFF